PDIGGPFAPYRQSERLEIYAKYAKELLEKDLAYFCFCSDEELERKRELSLKLGNVPHYDGTCRKISRAEAEFRMKNGEQACMRFKSVEKEFRLHDLVRGEVVFQPHTVGDFVILRKDGMPVYNFCCVIDDHLMKITHVIRGEEWLSSTPKHVLLYDAFGWERPQFAHLPLLLNPDRSKLSKRQGDVAVEDYRDKGYLKEALINFVALLGWNAGDDREFYYLNELIEAFSLERVNKAGAVFDIVKLNSLNAEHLRKKSNQELLELLRTEIDKSDYASLQLSDEYLLLIIEAMKERVTFVHEFISNCKYFYEAPKEYDQKSVEKNWKADTPEQLKKLVDAFSVLVNPTKEDFEHALTKVAEELNIGKGKLIHPLRLAVSGQSTGPGVFDILFILGKDEVIKRINSAISSLS
ncbi:MAG: glutamate--tRNA ligase, partial [Ignavibacteria bacterium]|nr:glutamate--tRNA ligase [Ignavibacteria bacterium]